MLSRSRFFFVSSSKTSPVVIRTQLSEAKLAPTPNYKPLYAHRLSKKFDRVDHENRFESLSIILSKLSSHVGRRQYAMQHDLTIFLQQFKNVGLDWHELMALPNDKLISVLDNQIGMTPSQRRIFMTAVHTKCCGVLVEGSSAQPRAVCLNRGLPEHGFRCGKKGHTGLLYFEGKTPRSQLTLGQDDYGGDFSSISSLNNNNKKQLTNATTKAEDVVEIDDDIIPKVEKEFTVDKKNESKKDASSKQKEDEEKETTKDQEDSEQENSSATKYRVSTQPDFRIVGRLFHETHPRAWSAPTVSSFEVATIGYDFYIHPSDPRVKPQLVGAAEDWDVHAEALRNVIWELLEHHAVERTTTVQPFEVSRGDVRSEKDVLDVLKNYYSTVDPETGVIIENVMKIDDEAGERNKRRQANSSSSIVTTPWFTPSEPRPLDENTGAPLHFPISPSIAVQCIYRQPSDIDKYAILTPQEQQRRLVEPPYLEFRMFGHKSLCFSWPTNEVRKKAVAEILDVARRVPFALPFTLYFRVDSAQVMSDSNGRLRTARDDLIRSKREFFDLTRYQEVWGGSRNQNVNDDDDDSDDKNEDEVVETEDVDVKNTTKGEADDVEDNNSSNNNKNAEEKHKEELEAFVDSLNPDGWD